MTPIAPPPVSLSLCYWVLVSSTVCFAFSVMVLLYFFQYNCHGVNFVKELVKVFCYILHDGCSDCAGGLS